MKHNRPWLPIAAVLLTVGILIVLYTALRPIPPTVPAEGEADFCFIDVGQGDCTLIRTHAGDILIDAGPNLSETELLAELDLLGVDSLALAVFTHPHEDHIGGADAILEKLPVDTVMLPEISEEDAAQTVYKRLTERIGESTRLVTVTEDTVLSVGSVTLTLFCNQDAADGADGNAVSLVVRADVGETSVLIMGDAEAETEMCLTARMGDGLAGTVLRVGHHGSDTSTTDELLDAVRPAYAVISVGAGNSYGHPTGRVLSRLTDRGIRVWRTDTDGTVILHTDGHTVTPEN